MDNFLPLRREVMEHWTYHDPEIFKLWITLLFSARYIDEPCKVMYRGTLYTANYGDVLFGRESWSVKLGISPGKIRHAINRFIKDEMITLSPESDKRLTIFNITNYAIYNQVNDQVNDLGRVVSQENHNHVNDHDGTMIEPGWNHDRTIEEEGKKEKKVKTVTKKKSKPDDYTKEFEAFWDLYPKKTGKQLTFMNWNKRLKAGEIVEDMVKAGQNYVESFNSANKDIQYMKSPSNFIREGLYCEYIEGAPSFGKSNGLNKYADEE